MTVSPNVWNLGDRATIKQGRFQVPVVVRGFHRDMVRVEYQDGTKGLRKHGDLCRG